MGPEKHITTGNGIRITKRDTRIAVSQGGVRIRHEDKPVKAESANTGFIYLLIDCSASMNGDKLNQAKRGAIKFAKDALRKGYLTGLIQFDSSAVHLCDPQRELAILEEQLRRITIGGSTNMTQGLLVATEKLAGRIGSRVIVIATDGDPDNRSTALRAAEKAKKNGVDIISIGTDDANRDFLKKLASRSDLGIKVSRSQFEKGITQAAESLPQLQSGRP